MENPQIFKSWTKLRKSSDCYWTNPKGFCGHDWTPSIIVVGEKAGIPSWCIKTIDPLFCRRQHSHNPQQSPTDWDLWTLLIYGTGCFWYIVNPKLTISGWWTRGFPASSDIFLFQPGSFWFLVDTGLEVLGGESRKHSQQITLVGLKLLLAWIDVSRFSYIGLGHVKTCVLLQRGLAEVLSSKEQWQQWFIWCLCFRNVDKAIKHKPSISHHIFYI